MANKKLVVELGALCNQSFNGTRAILPHPKTYQFSVNETQRNLHVSHLLDVTSLRLPEIL